MIGYIVSKSVARNELKKFLSEFSGPGLNLMKEINFNDEVYLDIDENTVYFGENNPKFYITFHNGEVGTKNAPPAYSAFKLSDEMSRWLIQSLRFSVAFWHNDVIEQVKRMDEARGNTAMNKMIDMTYKQFLNVPYMNQLLAKGFMFNNMYFYSDCSRADRGIWFANRITCESWSLEQILFERP